MPPAPLGLVLDTNIVVAGLLWNGKPRQLLDLAINDIIFLYSSPPLLNELVRTLGYPKFGKRLVGHATTPTILTGQYAALATVVTPAIIPPTVLRDTDDDAVLACALAAKADYIISGDAHLLDLKQYQSIPIITATAMLKNISVPKY